MFIKKTACFISYAALFLIPFFALIVAYPLFFPFITGKAFFFRILVEIGFVGWVIYALYEPSVRPKLTPLTIAVTAFTLVALVADLLGVAPLKSLWSNFERMEGWIAIIHLWAFYMVMTHLFGEGEEGRKHWRTWFNTVLVGGFCVALYGIFQLAGFAEIHQGNRVDASLGNATYMAVYMLWNAGIAAYLFTIARKKYLESNKEQGTFSVWMYGILAVFFSFMLYETATRGTILGLIGGIAAGLLIYAIFAKGSSPRSRYISGGIIVAMIVLGGVFIGVKHSSFVQNSPVLSRLASIDVTNGETAARLYIWQMAAKGWEQRPILGWGQENFNFVFNANYDPRLFAQEQWFDRAHNVYIDWLIASGIIGLLAYLSLYVLFLVGVWKSDLTIGVKSTLTALLIGYAVHNIFVFDNIASYILFFAALGFVSSLKPGKHISFLGTEGISSEAVEYIAAPVALVALVLVVYFFNIKPLQANTRLITALQSCTTPTPDPTLFLNIFETGTFIGNQETREQLLSCTASVISRQEINNQLKQGYFALAQQAIADQIASTKVKDARIYTLAGSFMDSIGRYDLAQTYLETAHELSPKKQTISSELALDYINNKQPDKALAILKSTYEEEPRNEQVQLTYAIALVVNGKEAEARQLFGNKPSIFVTQQMAQAYAVARQYQKAIAVYEQLVASSTDTALWMQYVQTQYANGDKYGAVQSLKKLETIHPEYKEQIEALIKQA